jgi:hypothetical protein
VKMKLITQVLILLFNFSSNKQVIDKYFSNRTFYTLESLRDEEVC